jgi:hypothetical protein
MWQIVAGGVDELCPEFSPLVLRQSLGPHGLKEGVSIRVSSWCLPWTNVHRLQDIITDLQDRHSYFRPHPDQVVIGIGQGLDLGAVRRSYTQALDRLI